MATSRASSGPRKTRLGHENGHLNLLSSTLAVSPQRRRKKGRDTNASVPSGVVAETKLDKATTKEDPKERLKRIRQQMTAKSAVHSAA